MICTFTRVTYLMVANANHVGNSCSDGSHLIIEVIKNLFVRLVTQCIGLTAVDVSILDFFKPSVGVGYVAGYSKCQSGEHFLSVPQGKPTMHQKIDSVDLLCD